MSRVGGAAVALSLCHGATAAPTPNIAVVGSGEPVVVYQWAGEQCDHNDVPDAPLRAFRNASGGVTAFASDAYSRVYSGPNLLSIRHSCRSSLPSARVRDPSAFNDLRYVTATWTDDGVHVDALVHHEYHAAHFPGMCAYPDDHSCWYTTVIAAHSDDGGEHFRVADPPVVVASAAFRQDFQQGRHRGFFNPSNIFFHDGFYYTASDTTGGPNQKAGLCLFRTRNVHDPKSWRGYSGGGFDSRAIDPYRSDPSGAVPCEPMKGPGTVGAIVFHRPSGMFLMVFQMVSRAVPNGQTAYVWSKDLQNWSGPKVLWSGSDMSSKSCADGYRYAYPSILDQGSPGRNFDTIGNHAFLFLTRLRVADCKVGWDRDLVRIPVEITAP